MIDLYAALGVQRSASTAEITKQYRKLSKECHPDKHPDDAAAVERFKEISLAFDILSDPEKRAIYDTTGEMPVVDAQARKDTMTARILHDIVHIMIKQIVEAGNKPKEHDMVDLLKQQVRGEIKEIPNQINEIEETCTILVDLAARFKSEDGLLKSVTLAPMPALRKAIDNLAEREWHLQKILDMLGKAKFSKEKQEMMYKIMMSGVNDIKFGTWTH